LIDQVPVKVNYKLIWNQGKFWKFKSSKFTLKPSYTFQQFQKPRTILPEDLIDGSVVITADSEIFDFKDPPQDYFLFDASWSFAWKSLNASITVKNLFNNRFRDYLNEMRYFADEPGRNILFNVIYKFKSKSNDRFK
jgi:iron complex outermembrane receptor protein